MYENMKQDPEYAATLNLIYNHGYSERQAFELLANYYFKYLKAYKEQEALNVANKVEEPPEEINVNQVILENLVKAVKEYNLDAVHAFSQAYQRIN